MQLISEVSMGSITRVSLVFLTERERERERERCYFNSSSVNLIEICICNVHMYILFNEIDNVRF